MVQKKNLGLYAFLSLITCGLFTLYWIYTLNEDADKLAGEKRSVSGGMVIVFSILTCGIYMLFWAYQQGEIINKIAEDKEGMSKGGRQYLYLILSACGLGILAYMFMQDALNAACPDQPQYQQPQYQQPYGQPQYQQPYGQPQYQQPQYQQPQYQQPYGQQPPQN